MANEQAQAKNGGGDRSEKRCRGLLLLLAKMRTTGTSVAQLARHLDRSWTFASALVEGSARPDVDDAVVLRERYGVPIESWRRR